MSAPTATTRLLLVEDSEPDRKMVVRALSGTRDGMELIEAATVQEALGALDSGKPFHCILLDYRLPEQDGLSFVREWFDVQGHRKPPIILLTGVGDEQVATEAIRTGVFDYFSKAHLTPNRLRASVANAIEKYNLEHEHEEAQRQLALRTEQLELANESLKQFVHVASHDLKAPLRGIRGLSDILVRRADKQLDDHHKDLLLRIGDSAGRMQELLDDLLFYASAGHEKTPITIVPLARVVRMVVKDMSQSIEASGATVVADDLPPVPGDTALLRVLMQNLIENAIKYCDGSAPDVRISGEQKSDEIVITVHDNGVGIASEDHERVFEAFTRLHTTPTTPGSGLGLAICRRILKTLGGRIWVESDLGTGTRFSFALPTAIDSDQLPAINGVASLGEGISPPATP